MRIILRKNTIWAQTTTAGTKLISFKSRKNALHAIKWCSKFNTPDKAGTALIDYCNKVGLTSHGTVISNSFGELSGKKADFYTG